MWYGIVAGPDNHVELVPSVQRATRRLSRGGRPFETGSPVGRAELGGRSGLALVEQTRTRRTLALIAALIAVVVMTAAVAVASIPDAQGVIHGCYKRKTGALRVGTPRRARAVSRVSVL